MATTTNDTGSAYIRRRPGADLMVAHVISWPFGRYAGGQRHRPCWI